MPTVLQSERHAQAALQAEAGEGERSERTAASAAPAAPRGVTRGESSNSVQAAKVDWLHATFEQPAMTVQGMTELIGRLCDRPVWGVEGGGLFGFSTRIKLYAYALGMAQDFGSICYGGEAQQGRWLLQITGTGCRLVNDWAGLQDLLEGFGAKLTRIDLAVDCLDGQLSVDDAEQMHVRGEFNGGGRRPSSSVAGDWVDRINGRTLYVGKAQNGKMLRVYEKGKQLGDLTSPWVRFEVQLGNRDRVIPLDTMTQPDKYFAGCYPALASMLDFAGETIPTTRAETKVSIAFLLYHLKRCYGKVLDTVQRASGVSDSDLIEEVRVFGAPRRVNPSGVEAGVDWADVQALLKRW